MRKGNVIFLADDDPDDFEMFSEVVLKADPTAEILWASDGIKLLEYLNKITPDIIFLDINMPLMNGLECLVEIRKNSNYNHIPVIMVTTSANYRDIDFSFANGANYYFLKPNSFIALEHWITHLYTLDWKEGLKQPDKELYFLDANQID